MERKIKTILEILKKNKTMVLSTFGENLWSSRIYFASKGLEIYAIIEKSRNFGNISKNRRVFFVIDSGKPDLFVQGEGEVEILGAPMEREEERALLFQKNIELIPFVKKSPDLVVIKIRPKRVFLSDFRTVFHPREELIVTEEMLNQALSLDKGMSKLAAYFKATRPFAFTATLVSVLVGAFLSPTINIPLLLLVFFGVLFAHAGINALNDLMDYRYGIDDWLVLGASRMLQDKILSEKEQKRLVFALLSLALVVGVILTLIKGIWVILLAAIGGIIGIFYQVKPIGLKYRALGDLAVFLAFGPLLALGSYFVMSGEISFLPAVAAIPIGLLVIAILHGNNFRDLVEDVKAGYKTVASLLGVKGSSLYYAVLISLSYILLVLFVLLGWLPSQSLLALLTLPVAYKNILLAQRPNYLQFGLLDLFTAKLHLSFGLLMSLGLLLSRLK